MSNKGQPSPTTMSWGTLFKDTLDPLGIGGCGPLSVPVPFHRVVVAHPTPRGGG